MPSPLKHVARIVRCENKGEEGETRAPAAGEATSAAASRSDSPAASSLQNPPQPPPGGHIPAGQADPEAPADELAALNIIDGETGAHLVDPAELVSVGATPDDLPMEKDKGDTVSTLSSSTTTSTPSTPRSRTGLSALKNPLALAKPITKPLKPLSNLARRRKPDHPDFAVSGPQPACQLFSVFKALAAEDDDVDVEESESESDIQITSDTASGSDTAASASASDTTLMSDTTPHPHQHHHHLAKEVHALEDKAEAESEAVKRWLHDTVSKNKAMGERFAALSVNALSPFTKDGREAEEESADARPPLLSRASHTRQNETSDDDEEWHPAVNCAESPQEVDSPEADALQAEHEDIADLDENGLIARFSREDIPVAEKLAVIQEEFGDIASRMVNEYGESDPEVLLAESQGSLFKGVMMIGNLHLTTHRLVFHALLPPEQMYYDLSKNTYIPTQTEEETAARAARPNIIIAGPVTVHRSGIFQSKKRVWMELSPDMLTTYPSADEAGRVRPLYSILMSTTLRLAPFDNKHPLDFFLHYQTSTTECTLHFTIDNEASALRWRRHFESVLYRYARERFREAHCKDAVAQGTAISEAACRNQQQWGLLRCCVPLDRATIKGMGEFHSFATLVNLEVELDHHTQVSWHPEEIAKGNYDLYGRPMSGSGSGSGSGATTPTRSRSLRLPSLKRALPTGSPSREASRERSPLVTSPTTMSMDEKFRSQPSRYLDTAFPSQLFKGGPSRSNTNSSNPPSPRESHDIANTFDFLVGVLNRQSWFADSLEAATAAAHRRTYKPGEPPAKMVLDVGGYDCLATDDDLDSSSSDGTGETGERDDDDDEGSGKPQIVIETRKAEKAAMAARIFGLREDEGIWLKRCYVLHGLVPARGHIIVNPRYICFWRRARLTSDIKYRFNTRDVKGAEVAPPLRLGLYGLALKIHGHHDLRFEMFNEKGRDEVIRRVNAVCSVNPRTTPTSPTAPVRSATTDSGVSVAPSWHSSATTSTANTSNTAASIDTGTPTTDSSAPSTPTTVQTADEIWADKVKSVNATPRDIEINPALRASGQHNTIKQAADVLAPPADMLLYPRALSEQELSYMPFVANRPWAMDSGWNVRLTPRRFTMLTIGSRGDVQPYIALALRLMQDGHKVVIVTHDEFKKWIEGYGIEHRQAGGDPTALMKLSTEHRMFSPGFFKEALGGFRAWLDELLVDAWNACQDADVLIESPSAMAGVHIAESLKIPYFRAFTMPWTRTAAYPQAFMVPAFEMGPSFNYSTYVLFDNIMWRATSGQINRWRKKHLGLGATDQSSLSISKVPFLYNFSPAVVPKPLDWYDDITITGYWNLENSDTDWTPPESLITWMDKARAEGKPIVYIGFGSIVVPNPSAVTRSIVKGVEKAGVRAIIAKGWSARDSKPSDEAPFEYPDSCYPLDKVPHGWLFPKIQAAMHHGGAGTVGASLRAGIPTLIKPWFGDQHFWALRVTKLGAGMKVASLRSDDIADALRKATTNAVMIEKATRIGERIRAESGVDAAVQAIHFNIVRAARDRGTLKKEDSKNRAGANPGTTCLPISKPSIGSPAVPLPSLAGIPAFANIANLGNK